MLTAEMQAKGAEKPHFMRVLEPLNGLVWGINIPAIYKYILNKIYDIYNSIRHGDNG